MCSLFSVFIQQQQPSHKREDTTAGVWPEHDPGTFYDPERDLIEDLAGLVLALGVDGEWNYVTNRKEGLKEGQIIVLGTDGIWETQNPQGELLGKEAICKIIRENANA